MIASLSALWGETIVPCGGTAANSLGLTTQMPVKQGLSKVMRDPVTTVDG